MVTLLPLATVRPPLTLSLSLLSARLKLPCKVTPLKRFEPLESTFKLPTTVPPVMLPPPYIFKLPLFKVALVLVNAPRISMLVLAPRVIVPISAVVKAS